jgi:hypothetical protein
MKMTDRKKKSQKMRKRRFGQQAKTVEPILTKSLKRRSEKNRHRNKYNSKTKVIKTEREVERDQVVSVFEKSVLSKFICCYFEFQN